MDKLLNHFLLLVFFFLPFLVNGTDSPISRAKESSTQTILSQKITHLKIQADSLYDINEYDSSILQYLNYQEYTKNSGFLKESNEVYYDIGYNYYSLNEYPLAIQNFSDYLLLHPNVEKNKKSKILNKLSQSAKFLGDLDRAYSYQLESLLISESLENKLGIARGHYEIGNILQVQENYRNALDHYQTALEYQTVLQDSFTLFSCLAALGTVYHELEEIDSSLLFNNRSLQIAFQLNYETGKGYAYQNLASNFFSLNHLDNSIRYCELALEIKEKINDPWGASGASSYLGFLYLRNDDLPQAQKYLDQALKISQEIKAKARLSDIYLHQSELFSRQGYYQKANKSLKQHIEINKEIINENSMMKMEAARVHYEVTKKDREIKNLKKDQDVQHFKIRAAIYIVVLMLLFTIILAYSYSKLKVTLRELANKNDIIAKQNLALEQSNQELEQFAYVASHDMREPIRTIRSFNGILKKKYSDALGHKGLEFLHFIDDASKRMDSLLTDLLDYSRVNTSKDVKTIQDLTDIAFLATSNLNAFIEENDATVIIKDLPKIAVHKIQFIRLFQNLINNGIKYNKSEHKKIEINSSASDLEYTFRVKDNGIGISNEDHAKVFEIFRRLHSNADYEGSGIGLATCKKIVENHGGRIWIESNGTGTSFNFTLPRS